MIVRHNTVLLTTTLALVGVLAGSALAGGHGGGTQPRSVIELFTTQSCSLCPPANKLLGEYAERNDVLALSFNVDVWDWFGWKDTLASPDHTERQRAYAAAMGERDIYAPQVVVDGRIHVVGSNRNRIEQALRKGGGSQTVTISLSTSPDSISVTIGEAPKTDMPNGVLWLIMYDHAVTVAIEGGENIGRTITYNNVVRKLRPVAMWKGKAMTIDVPRGEIERAEVDNSAFLLQVDVDDGALGPIMGAATISTDW